MDQRIFLGLGGNIGDVKKTFENVLLALQGIPGISDLSRSRFFRTKAESDIEQADFLNCVVSFLTPLSPEELFPILAEIEKNEGKKTKPKNAPRPIDIDILVFGTQYVSTKDLTIPHPFFRNRLFVLVPFLDIQERVQFPRQDGTLEFFDIRKQIDELCKISEYFPESTE